MHRREKFKLSQAVLFFLKKHVLEVMPELVFSFSVSALKASSITLHVSLSVAVTMSVMTEENV